MKKSIIFLLLAALMLVCVACSNDTAQLSNSGDTTTEGGNSVVETTAPVNDENAGSDTESGGQRVTFGKLEEEDVAGLYLATDQCFVYREDSRFGGYGAADYDGYILAKAKYSNYEMVGDKLVFWNTSELVVYNTNGERLYQVSPAEGDEGFSANMDASDVYYCLDRVVEEHEYEHMNEYGSTLYTYDGNEVCSFKGTLRTYPNEDGFFLASTNRSTTNAVIDMNGNELELTAADGRKIDSFSIHQEGDVYGGAFLFGTKYGRFDKITFENGDEQYNVSGVIDAATKTVTLLDDNVRLYDCNSDYVIAVVTDGNGDKIYGLYTDGFGELVINLSEHQALGGYSLHDAKFFSREKGYILLTLSDDGDDYYAIIDTNGEVIVSATEGYVPFLTKSDYLSDNGYYPFATEDGNGVADLSGNIIIPCGQYQGMTSFIRGHAVVNGTSVINDKGDVVFSLPQ